MGSRRVRAVLFDSGGVLLRPVGGRWNPRFDSLGVHPAECLFVDDVPRLVAAAIELGYQGRAVRRDGGQVDGVPAVSDLRAILPLV